MKHLLPLVIIGLLALGTPAAAQAQTADAVVLADVLRADGNWVACGRVHQLGVLEYRIRRVESGNMGGDRITVVASCPLLMSFAGHRLARLRLTSDRPRAWPVAGVLEGAPEERWYLVQEDPVPGRPGLAGMLGWTRRAVSGQLREAGSEGDQVNYEEGFSARYVDGRAVLFSGPAPSGVGMRVWLGVEGLRWQNRRRVGSTDEGQFRIGTRLVGHVIDGQFEIRIRTPN